MFARLTRGKGRKKEAILLQHIRKHGGEDLLLAGVVRVERRFLDAHRRGNVAHARAVVSLLQKESKRLT
ncbi:hypothetical protein SDC9_204426 [bioreactor metagenome]|uniref:Uncharacterized protein n=1 Tax=bioreactor metagenome TaxID=1076179 RepID=A0A645J8F1_9ZZZZ